MNVPHLAPPSLFLTSTPLFPIKNDHLPTSDWLIPGIFETNSRPDATPPVSIAEVPARNRPT